MSPHCDNCGAHVDPLYHRVFRGNDGKLHGCPSCASPATRARDAAGVDSEYQTRTDPRGEKVSADGGESR